MTPAADRQWGRVHEQLKLANSIPSRMRWGSSSRVWYRVSDPSSQNSAIQTNSRLHSTRFGSRDSGGEDLYKVSKKDAVDNSIINYIKLWSMYEERDTLVDSTFRLFYSITVHRFVSFRSFPVFTPLLTTTCRLSTLTWLQVLTTPSSSSDVATARNFFGQSDFKNSAFNFILIFYAIHLRLFFCKNWPSL